MQSRDDIDRIIIHDFLNEKIWEHFLQYLLDFHLNNKSLRAQIRF